jgi:hypothetical protein
VRYLLIQLHWTAVSYFNFRPNVNFNYETARIIQPLCSTFYSSLGLTGLELEIGSTWNQTRFCRKIENMDSIRARRLNDAVLTRICLRHIGQSTGRNTTIGFLLVDPFSRLLLPFWVKVLQDCSARTSTRHSRSRATHSPSNDDRLRWPPRRPSAAYAMVASRLL